MRYEVVVEVPPSVMLPQESEPPWERGDAHAAEEVAGAAWMAKRRERGRESLHCW